ncbi:unnamed protein product [Dicrocoelium dendriticum]|nr:unnamed protein product [Dicrocoelium dendriticum]
MLTLMTQQLADIKRAFEDPLRSLDPDSSLVRLSSKLLDGITRSTTQDEGEESKSSTYEDSKQILAYETGKIPISHRGFAIANALSLRRKTLPTIQRRQPSKTFDSIDEILMPLKSPTLPKLRGRSLSRMAPQQSREVLTLTPLRTVDAADKSNIVYQPRSLALVAKVGETQTMPQAVTAALKQKAVTSKEKEKITHEALESVLEVHSPVGVSETSEFTGVQTQMMMTEPTKQRGSSVTKEQTITDLHPVQEMEQSMHDVVPTIVATAPTSDTMKSVTPKAGTPVEESSPVPEWHALSTSKLVSSTESIAPHETSERLKARIGVTEAKFEIEPTSSEPVTEFDSMHKVTGVWTWLDNMLAATARGTTRPHSVLKSVRLEAKKRAMRGYEMTKPIKMIAMLEEKVARLQHLVDDIEETESWHPTMLRAESDRSGERRTFSLDEESFISISQREEKRTVDVATFGRKRGETRRRVQSRKDVQMAVGLKSITQPSLAKVGAKSYGRGRHFADSIISTETPTADMRAATKYLQAVMPPGHLTRLLAEIRDEKGSPDAVAMLERAFTQAARRTPEAQEQL